MWLGTDQAPFEYPINALEPPSSRVLFLAASGPYGRPRDGGGAHTMQRPGHRQRHVRREVRHAEEGAVRQHARRQHAAKRRGGSRAGAAAAEPGPVLRRRNRNRARSTSRTAVRATPYTHPKPHPSCTTPGLPAQRGGGRQRKHPGPFPAASLPRVTV